MKKCITFCLAFMVINFAFTQNRKPLTGKGEVLSRKEVLPSFKEVEIFGMDGLVVIEVNKNAQPEIICNVDENLGNLLRYEVKGKRLSVFIEGNRNNVLYIENTRINVKIVSPELEEIRYEGNADIAITGIEQQELRVKKQGNGDMTLSGIVNHLTIYKEGNGKVNAKALITETVSVTSFGNGNILVNASESAKGILNGNGYVKNEGSGETNGTSFGNGKFISKIESEKLVANPIQRVKVTFVNESTKRKEYYVKGLNESGSGFSYGLALGPLATESETLPIGTEIFRNGKLIATLKSSDNNQKIKL